MHMVCPCTAVLGSVKVRSSHRISIAMKRAPRADAALDPAIVRELAEVVCGGDAILFTGAGFSLGARDAAGDPVPDSETMRRELHALLFDDEPLDDSTLPDLYDVALIRAPDELERYLARRLRIGQLCDIEHYSSWFTLRWRRIYTLNVDDLDSAFRRLAPGAPRLRSISATRVRESGEAADGLEVVHLNGDVRDGAATLTFSTLQYAARLCGQEPAYRDLIEDLARSPFVFVGTTLDEVVLWKHLELHKRRGGEPLRHRSYLIAPSLSRARHLLLEDLGLVWVPSTLEVVGAHLRDALDGA
jgi:hypothetical protein